MILQYNLIIRTKNSSEIRHIHIRYIRDLVWSVHTADNFIFTFVEPSKQMKS